MASLDPENVPVTPQKPVATNLAETPSSTSKRALKPLSPSKYNNNSVGKLNFLQNDNLDDHFDCIHGSHEEMKQQLSTIEVQTKQTNDDLEQLFDRLKNNNQHLNKLLESIAQYSNEVTTEGNATKSDVTKILERLEDLSPANLEVLIAKLLQTSKNDTVRELKSLITNSQGDPDDANIEVLSKLNNVERALNNFSGGSNKDIEKYVSSVTTETTNELMKVSDLLRHMGDSQKSTIDLISGKIDSLSTSDHTDVLSRLQQLVEQQTDVVNSIQSGLRNQAALDSYKDLQSKHAQLLLKYNSLCGYYESKYKDLIQLETRFSELTSTVDKLEDKVANIDVQKYDRLQKLHTDKLNQLGKTSFTASKKRITSMPIKQLDALPNIHEHNNSDQEF